MHSFRSALRIVSLSLASILSLALAPAHGAPDDDSHWSPRFGIGTLEGTSGSSVSASVTVADSEYVYFGGIFSKVGGYRVNNIVRYHKKTGAFQRLGSGANACGTNGEVLVIKIVQGGVHVGGRFTKVGVDTTGNGGEDTGPYAFYDGKDWKAAGPRLATLNGSGAMVSAIEFDGSNTYIGGYFGKAGEDTIRNIARYKGGTRMEALWDPGELTNGVDGAYNSFSGFRFTGIRVTQSSIMVGGNFSIAGGANVTRVAQYNLGLGRWDGMKGGLDQAPSMVINAMDQDHLGKVYFAYKNVHIYKDTGWAIMEGTEATTSVTRFLYNTPFGSMMVGGGGPAFDSGFFSFNGTGTWKSFDPAKRGFTLAQGVSLAADKERVWIGSSGGVQGAIGMAWYDGKDFGPLGNGLRVTRQGGLGFDDFVEFEGKLIGAGSFSHLGSTAAEGVARWEGDHWESMGSEFQSIWRLVVFKGKLYAVGTLQKPIEGVVGGLARWTGSAWEIVPGFEKMRLEAAAATDKHLYLAGNYITGGPMVKWDGDSIEVIGKEITSSTQIGINGIVPRWEGNVCVSGYFNKVNGLPAGGAACYDGATKTWTGLGAALPTGTYASHMARIGNDLYMGCFCTFPSGAKNIARWDGKDWVDVGGGTSGGVGGGGVQRLVANGSDLYAVGYFAKAGDVTANGVARWDGKNWTALGSGVWPLQAVSVYVGPGGLWVGGYFTLAGGIPSRNVALYGNVEKKDPVPMGVIRRPGDKAARRSPLMRRMAGGMEFGAGGEAHRADGRHLETPTLPRK